MSRVRCPLGNILIRPLNSFTFLPGTSSAIKENIACEIMRWRKGSGARSSSVGLKSRWWDDLGPAKALIGMIRGDSNGLCEVRDGEKSGCRES